MCYYVLCWRDRETADNLYNWNIRRKGLKKYRGKYDIAFFMLYAFGIPLICIVLMTYIPLFQYGILQFILYGIEAASPSLAAIIMSSKERGFKGVKQFLIEKYHLNLNTKLCFIGFCIPVILLTLTKLLTYVTPYNNTFITIPSFKKVIIITWALVAEELGWRGYLQDKIEERYGDKATPFIIGSIWTLWHYHFFLTGTMDVPIVFFIYGCILESYGYYIITKLAKGNILPASLWHFAGNLFINLYLINPEWNGGSIVPYIMSSLSSTSYLGAFIYFKRKGL